MKHRILLIAASILLIFGMINNSLQISLSIAWAQGLNTIISEQNNSSALASLLPQPQQFSKREQQFKWDIKTGDWLDINVRSNTMIIRRADNSKSSQIFQIGSGLDQDEDLTWAGVTYNPRTPADEWIIKEKNQQNLYWTFGTKEKNDNGKKITEQLFLRMYRKNNAGKLYRTKYGFHTTPQIETIITKNKGYGSFGCLLARYQLLKFLEEIYDFQIAQGEEGLKLVTSWES